MRTVQRSFLGIAVIAIGVAAWLATPMIRGVVRRHRIATTDGIQRFEYINSARVDLREGMDQGSVERLVGRPDNQDDSYIWYWCCNKAGREELTTWRTMYRDGGGPSIFLVFGPSGRLAGTLIKRAESSPWDYFHEMAKTRGWAFKDRAAWVSARIGPDPRTETTAIQDGHDPYVPGESTAASVDDIVLEGVRRYYWERWRVIPRDLKIVDRGGDIWIVAKDPDWIDARVGVDSRTGEVLWLRPGE